MKSVRNIAVLMSLLLVLFAAVGHGQQLQQVTMSAETATLSEIKGKVIVRPPNGPPAPAQRGQQLNTETAIETEKGSAVLNLQDGSQVLVKDHTRLVLKSPTNGRNTFFELLLGKIVAEVKRRVENAPSFKMGTPSAVITVRGTRFGVEVTKKRTTFVDVYQGLVDVAGIVMENRAVQLKPGFWTRVEHDHEPEQPRRERESNESRERDDDRLRGGMVRRSPGAGSSGSQSSDEDEYRRYVERPETVTQQSEQEREND